MKNLKRKLALITTMVMMCTVLASCGGDDGSTSTSTSTSGGTESIDSSSTSGGTESIDSSSMSGGTESIDSSSISGGTESIDSSSISSSNDEDEELRKSLDQSILRAAAGKAQGDYLLSGYTSTVEYFITADKTGVESVVSSDKASSHNWTPESKLYSQAMAEGKFKLIFGNGAQILFAGIVEDDEYKDFENEELRKSLDENILRLAAGIAQSDYLLSGYTDYVEYFITADRTGVESVVSSDKASSHNWTPESKLYSQAMAEGTVLLVLEDGGKIAFVGILE